MKLSTVWIACIVMLCVGFSLLPLWLPCTVKLPLVSISNVFLLLVAVLLLPVVAFLGAPAAKRWPSIRPIVLGLCLILLGDLFLYSDLGVLLTSKSMWVALAEGSENPTRRACYVRSVVQATPYGPNVFEQMMKTQRDASVRRRLFEAAAVSAPTESWSKRFQARSAAESKENDQEDEW